MQDQISYVQQLGIVDPIGEQYEVMIDLDELLSDQTVNFNGRELKISDQTAELIRSWMHEKKIYQLELLESGELEDRTAKVLNLNNWQGAVSQAIMQDYEEAKKS
jgi:hypothetical protein